MMLLVNSSAVAVITYDVFMILETRALRCYPVQHEVYGAYKIILSYR